MPCGDNPADIDELNYSIYVDTLKEIVMDTNIEQTPLTIGIHGAWGSGKTSLMQMLQNSLNDNVKSLWFNAWEYDKADSVWTALFQNLINQMDNTTSETKKLTKTFLTVLTDLSIQGLTKGSMSFTDVKNYYENYGEQVDSIKNLRETFEKAVQEHVGLHGKYVIFIDDLDRCLPERAVEILESMKLFLGSKRCIFIIGVDKEVIWKGIEARYRTDYNHETPIKGKDYIEKIIQLPFNIPPLQNEDISKFIQDIYKNIFSTIIDENILKTISSGIEPNPRKTKQFLNLFNLLIRFRDQNIKSRRIEKGTIDDNVLAKFLVIQFRWDDFFNDLIIYYNLTGQNLINDLITLENSRSGEEKNMNLISNPLINEYDKYLDVNYFGLRSYLKKAPSFNDDLSAYIHLSQAASIKENEPQSPQKTLMEAIESSDENIRLDAIHEITLNIDKISNAETLLHNLLEDTSWVVRCKAVWAVFENRNKLTNYPQLVNKISLDKDLHVQRAFEWAQVVHIDNKSVSSTNFIKLKDEHSKIFTR